MGEEQQSTVADSDAILRFCVVSQYQMIYQDDPYFSGHFHLIMNSFHTPKIFTITKLFMIHVAYSGFIYPIANMCFEIFIVNN